MLEIPNSHWSRTPRFAFGMTAWWCMLHRRLTKHLFCVSRYDHPLPLIHLIRSIPHGISSNAKACLCIQGLFASQSGRLRQVEKLNGRDRFTEPHTPTDSSPRQGLQVKTRTLGMWLIARWVYCQHGSSPISHCELRRHLRCSVKNTPS